MDYMCLLSAKHMFLFSSMTMWREKKMLSSIEKLLFAGLYEENILFNYFNNSSCIHEETESQKFSDLCQVPGWEWMVQGQCLGILVQDVRLLPSYCQAGKDCSRMSACMHPRLKLLYLFQLISFDPLSQTQTVINEILCWSIMCKAKTSSSLQAGPATRIHSKFVEIIQIP